MKKDYIYIVIGDSHKDFDHGFKPGQIVIGRGVKYPSDPDTAEYEAEDGLIQWVDVNDVLEIGTL